jgi:cysteine desulfurase
VSGFQRQLGNPASSSHAFGQAGPAKVEQARRQVAELVGAQPEQIVWTSGATESNNLALKGVPRRAALPAATSSPARSNTRPSSIPQGQLQDAGVAVTYLVPDADGLITAQAVSEACARTPSWCR